MNASPKCTDPVILNLWHVIGDVQEMRPNTVYQTVLLEERAELCDRCRRCAPSRGVRCRRTSPAKRSMRRE